MNEAVREFLRARTRTVAEARRLVDGEVGRLIAPDDVWDPVEAGRTLIERAICEGRRTYGGKHAGRAPQLPRDPARPARRDAAADDREALRRSRRLLDDATARTALGLPPFVAADPGLASGFILAQVAAAALASKNKAMAGAASINNLPTTANKENIVGKATDA